MNTGMYWITGILVCITLIANIATKKNHGKPYFINFMIVLLVIATFYDTYDHYTRATNNMKHFKSNHTLKCHSGGGMYSSSNTYRVSAKNAWELDANYFIKDSLMIRANNCEMLYLNYSKEAR